MVMTQDILRCTGRTRVQQRAAPRLASVLRDESLCPRGLLPSERVIASHVGVSRPTLRHMLAAMEEHGLISTTRTGRVLRLPGHLSSAIAVIWQTHPWDATKAVQSKGWSIHTRFGIAQAIQASGGHVLLVDENALSDKSDHWLEALGIGGVLCGPHLSEPLRRMVEHVHKAKLPLVVYGDEAWSQSMDRVAPDHCKGAGELTQWLLAHGRRRILRVWVKPPAPDARWLAQRDLGHERAMAEASLTPLDPVIVPEVPRSLTCRQRFDMASHVFAGAIAPQVLGSTPVDAIMVLSDEYVPAMNAACRQLGREPGKDVAIVGYDNFWADIPERAFESAPPAATMDKCNTKIGEAMVDLLRQRLEGKLPLSPQLRLVPPRLVTDHVSVSSKESNHA